MSGRIAANPVRPFHVDYSPLRKARRVRELSQQELARAAGVHWSTINRLENNKTPNPSQKAIIAISKALGIPEWHLWLVIEDR